VDIANGFLMIKEKLWHQKIMVWSFFGLFFFLGLYILRDYSISTDEPEQRNIGMVSVKYVSEKFFPEFVNRHEEVKGMPDLKGFWDRDYGVVFEMPVAWLEQAIHIEDWRNIVYFRHLCTFLVNFWGAVAVYQLAKRRFKDWRLGLLAALMLLVTPRIFADLFYNDKDAVFLTVFAIATNTAVAFVERPSWRRVWWHALACACAIDVRIMGILIPLATLALVGLQAARGAYPEQRIGPKVAVYLGLLAALTIMFWPYLWEAPLHNFAEGFRNMSKFRWDGDILYAGGMVLGSRLPWHYSLVWIGVTTPVLYIIGFLAGAFLTIRQLVRRKILLYQTAEEWQDLLFLGLTLAPIIAVIVLHSVLYNAWRQLYFVYPSFLLVALHGLIALKRWRLSIFMPPYQKRWNKLWSRLCYATLAGTLLVTAGQMAAMHPFENTYFNVLAGRHVETRFEIDYWVLSYGAGLEWIARHDNRTNIVISAQRIQELEATRRMLLPYDRDRMKVVEESMLADYYLTTYYQHPGPYEEYAFELATIRAGGQRILSIFRPKW
jgi:hypothetical protein